MTADVLFAQEGKLLTLAKLAKAAYFVSEGESTSQNKFDAAAESIYEELFVPGNSSHVLNPLDAGDLSGIARGAVNNQGFFVHKNAVALIGSTDDALFVAIRGTNDLQFDDRLASVGKSLVRLGELYERMPERWSKVFENTGSLSNLGRPASSFLKRFDDAITPDTSHWIGKDAHWNLLKPLAVEIEEYLALHPEIESVYVTGHSLGGAMVVPFMNYFFEGRVEGVKFEAVTFASPGYGLLNGSDERITNFWNDNDIIRLPQAISASPGDDNIIQSPLGGGIVEHDMSAYLAAVRLLHESGVSDDLIAGYGSDLFDRLAVALEKQGDLIISPADGVSIRGTNAGEVILGSNGNDTIEGIGGNDILVGFNGADIFVLGVGSGADEIEDFRSGEDVLRIDDVLVDDINVVIGSAVVSGQDVTLSLGVNSSVLLVNYLLTAASLTDLENDVVFA